MKQNQNPPQSYSSQIFGFSTIFFLFPTENYNWGSCPRPANHTLHDIILLDHISLLYEEYF